jgi:hypothetical protein
LLSITPEDSALVVVNVDEEEDEVGDKALVAISERAE